MDENKVVQKIVKIFGSVIKEISEKDYTITAVVSTNKVDRYGDIVEPESFKKRLKLYKAHPVLLSSHDYYRLTSQIGEATKVTVTDEGLEMQFKYYVGQGNPEADWGWVLAQNKIAAFSIGFMSHEYEWIKEKDKESGNEYIVGRRFKDIELLEVSQVLVPANRQALQETTSYREVAGQLAEMAVKAFNSGDIKEVAAPEAKADNCACTQIPVTVKDGKCIACGKTYIAKDNEEAHYSETILDGGLEKKTQSQSQENVLKGVVEDAAKAALQ